MATLVQASTKFNRDGVSGTQNFTMPGNFTSGNGALLLLVVYGAAPTSVNINGTTATLVQSSPYAQGVACLYKVASLTGGSNAFSVTCSGSGDYITGAVGEFSGVDFSAELTKSAGNGSGGSPSITSASVTGPGLLASILMDEVGNPTLNVANTSGDTALWTENDSNSHQGGQGAYRNFTGTGARTSSWTWNSSAYRTLIAAWADTGGGAVDGTATGKTLSAAASLVAGSASGVRNATGSGSTLTASASLVGGAAAGAASRAGVTLSAAASLTAGAASGIRNATATGATISASASLTSGAASGGAAAAGSTLAASAALIPGSASGAGHASAPGASLAASASLTAGAASGAAAASGVTLAANASLTPGTAAGGGAATAAGVTLTAGATLATGAATGAAVASGRTLQAGASVVTGTAGGAAIAAGSIVVAGLSLQPGSAQGQRHGTAGAATLGLGVSLIPGEASTGGSASAPGVLLAVLAVLQAGAPVRYSRGAAGPGYVPSIQTITRPGTRDAARPDTTDTRRP